MLEISVRMDDQGRHAVFSDRTLLMDGLPLDEAESFASFFRASAQFQTGVSDPAGTGRAIARRTGATARRTAPAARDRRDPGERALP